MREQTENRICVDMMVDSLKKKKKILLEILSLTKEQETLFRADELETELFDSLLQKKGEWIDELNALDDGFERMFQKLSQEIESHRSLYQKEIQTMQGLIAEISELGVSIQAAENQNNERFKKFLVREREEIRSYHVNSKMATAYHQNMNNVHRTKESYFFNEKK